MMGSYEMSDEGHGERGDEGHGEHGDEGGRGAILGIRHGDGFGHEM